MTNEQLQTLATHIRANADQAVIDALAIRNDTEMARLYNLASASEAWRTSVSPDEYRAAVTWAEVDQLTAGKARIWEWMSSNMSLPLNPSDANIRAGIADAFAANTTSRANLLAIAKRTASVYENIFATGSGTKTLVIEGPLTYQIVGNALNNF